MLRFDKSLRKKGASSLWARFLVFLGGLFIALVGLAKMQQGSFAYTNGWGQTVFSPAAIVSGLIVAAFAFFPSGNWFYRRITTRPPSIDEQLHQAHLNHPLRHGHKPTDHSAPAPENHQDC